MCGGRQAMSSKPSGHAQQMLGGQHLRAGVVAQPSVAVWLECESDDFVIDVF